MPHILIIEDDTDINNATARYLRRHGCQCTQAFSGTEGRMLWKSSGCDLLLIDLMLPGLSGSELIDGIRRESRVPVIVLSARSGLSDKVELLGLGADDYMTKPYQLEELWARIQVQLRHASTALEDEVLYFRDWQLNIGEMALIAGGLPVELTPHEFKIVELMVRRPKKVFTKQLIYETVWQEENAIEDKTINVHISNIRAKLRPSGTESYIQTVWGIGFKLS
ncbi:response regulator transcription factor [Acutalibacter caecimuris]|uniref:response regulator transcription factor n=1 Tax=Acutalibacter caecimuris TaxID=3093657 RepID=UPI002AC96CBA|nr:response regulator transcription factor [Acutalibacter sp. M00118]